LSWEKGERGKKRGGRNGEGRIAEVFGFTAPPIIVVRGIHLQEERGGGRKKRGKRREEGREGLDHHLVS